MIQGGDFQNRNGTGKTCIYSDGGTFEDEKKQCDDDVKFDLPQSHEKAGLLSMANSGPNSNGSQFFITCGPCNWLDGVHVLFGRVADVESMFVIRKIESLQVDEGDKPRLEVLVEGCGEL